MTQKRSHELRVEAAGIQPAPAKGDPRAVGLPEVGSTVTRERLPLPEGVYSIE